MKVCSKCKCSLPVDSFGRHARSKDGLQAWCKSCKKTYDAELFQTSEKRRLSRTANAEKMRAAWRLKMIDYLSTHPCIDCGEPDIVVLEFDHVCGEKKTTVSTMYNLTWERTLDEIAKCEVVCANCHRRRTQKRGGHYRSVAQR